MLLKIYNKYFTSRVLVLIFVISFLYIYYFNKLNIIQIKDILEAVIIISAIYLVNIIVKKYFMNQIIKFNKFILKYFPILIKIRKELINIPFYLRIILSLYIYIDMFLIFVLRLKSRKQNIFYFIRSLIYFNIMIWITLPFYLINDLYVGILFFLEIGIGIKKFIISRIKFLLLSIIFALLFNISWINIIISIWILDSILTTYFYWFDNWNRRNRELTENWKLKSTALRIAYNQIALNYQKMNTELISIANYRITVILLFKGLLDEEKYKEQFINCRFRLFNDFHLFYVNKFWINYYIDFCVMKNLMWFWTSIDSDELFILMYINNYIIDNEFEINKLTNIFKTMDIKAIIDRNLSDKFYTDLYFLVFNVLVFLKKDETFLKEFIFLKENFNLSNISLLMLYNEENKEIKDFLIKLENLAKK